MISTSSPMFALRARAQGTPSVRVRCAHRPAAIALQFIVEMNESRILACLIVLLAKNVSSYRRRDCEEMMVERCDRSLMAASRGRFVMPTPTELGQVTTLWVKHTLGQSDGNKAIFLTDARRLSFGEALLIPVNICNNPNVTAAGLYKAVLEDMRFKKCQAQGVSCEQRVFQTPSCNYFNW